MRDGSIGVDTDKLFEVGANSGVLQASVTHRRVAKDRTGNRLDQNPSVTGNQPKAWFFTVRN